MAPQQSHPARDAHDTFFVKEPASTLTVCCGLVCVVCHCVGLCVARVYFPHAHRPPVLMSVLVVVHTPPTSSSSSSSSCVCRVMLRLCVFAGAGGLLRAGQEHPRGRRLRLHRLRMVSQSVSQEAPCFEGLLVSRSGNRRHRVCGFTRRFVLSISVEGGWVARRSSPSRRDVCVLRCNLSTPHTHTTPH
jgi:phenylalanyl-tRNA synthetase alpha subunit